LDVAGVRVHIKNHILKTNKNEILDNNSRIGFSLYDLDKNNEIKDINKIVDENNA